MNGAIFEFSTTYGYLRGKTTANVQVFQDKIVIERDTKWANIPREMTLSFSDITSISYDENRSNAWISFAVSATMPNSEAKPMQPMYAASRGEIVITSGTKTAPFSAPYAIVFPKEQKADAKKYYDQLLSIHKKTKSTLTAATVINQESSLDKLKKIKELLDMGVLSQTEYEEKRQELLKQI